MKLHSAATLKDAESAHLSRRMALVALAGLVSLRGLSSAALAQSFAPAPRPSGDLDVDFSWEMPKRYGSRAAELLGVGPEHIQRSPNDEGNRGGPLLVIIFGVIALVYLAEAIIRIRRELRYGGIIVQDNGRRLSIRNDPRLPGNVIIVKDKNGVSVRELRGNITARELISALPRNAGKAGGS